jgi:cyclase
MGANGANVGLISTGSGAILIDAPLVPSQARAWRRQIEHLSPEGVAYIITTDYHLGHALGTCYLPSALTIAHETAWKHLRALDRDVAIQRALEQSRGRPADLATQLADVRIVLPQLTVGKAMTLWCEGRRVDILHMGGHTPATLAVYVPDERVLFAGDLVVNGCHPYAGDCVCLQWLASLEGVRSMEVATIVPGHGDPAGLEIIEPVYAYLKDTRTRVEECYLAGHTRRETVERVRPLEAFPYAPDDEEHLRRFLRSSVERIYDEIKKAAIRSRQRAQ